MPVLDLHDLFVVVLDRLSSLEGRCSAIEKTQSLPGPDLTSQVVVLNQQLSNGLVQQLKTEGKIPGP